MRTTRRKFLRHMSLLTAAAAAPRGYAQHDMHNPVQRGASLLDTNALARYVDKLPIPAVMPKSGLRPSPAHPGLHIPYYRVPMQQFSAPQPAEELLDFVLTANVDSCFCRFCV